MMAGQVMSYSCDETHMSAVVRSSAPGVQHTPLHSFGGQLLPTSAHSSLAGDITSSER